MKLRKWQKFRIGDYVFVSLFFVIILVYVFKIASISILNNGVPTTGGATADYIFSMGWQLFFFVIVPFIIYDFIARRKKYKTID